MQKVIVTATFLFDSVPIAQPASELVNLFFVQTTENVHRNYSHGNIKLLSQT
jgi:hypothetical protein